MSRTLTAAATTKTQTPLGTEPIILVAISWNQLTPQYYADKDLVVGTINADGRLLEVGSINTVQKSIASGAVGIVSITLDDCDGVIKTLLDSTPIENTPITVYQHYEGGVEADLFKLFEGVITNPIEWSEAERILRFDSETRVDDRDIGFSLTSVDQLIQVSAIESLKSNPDATGKAWPLVMGTPLKVPVPKVIRSSQATTVQQFETGDATVTVEDGSEFDIGEICDLEVNGALFNARYDGANVFTILAANVAIHSNLDITARVVADPDFNNPKAFWLLNYVNDPVSLVGQFVHIADTLNIDTQINYVESQEGNKIILRDPFQKADGEYTLLAAGFRVTAASKVPLVGWTFTFNEEDTAPDGFDITIVGGLVTAFGWKIAAGTVLRKWLGPEYVVATIETGTVRAVYAKRDGVFTQIPDEFYEVTAGAAWQVFNPVTGITETFYNDTLFIPVTVVKFPRPLWQYDGAKWDVSQFYVTVTGPVNTNTADQIQYIVDTFSLLTADAPSFATVQPLLAVYPSNFAILSRENSLGLIEAIAWQARCAILVTDGTVKLKYLSAEPATVLTVDESVVEYKSISLGFTSAEDVVTRLQGVYKTAGVEPEFTYSVDTNVAKYGLREESVDMFIYNDLALVKKSIDFWATRKSNVWRIVRLNNFLQALSTEVFDALSLAFADTSLLGIAAIKGMVQAHEYNIGDGTVGLELWLPSIAGSLLVEAGAWVSDVGDVSPTAILTVQQVDPLLVTIPKKRTNKQSPAIVVRELNPATDPAALVAAGTHLVDVYDHGFDNPVTRPNVPADLTNPAAPVNDLQQVSIFEVETDNKAVVTQQTYIQSGAPSAVLANITSEVGAGVYNWALHLGAGPATGQASELNLSTGIIAGTKVVLHRVGADFHFFFPVEDCP